MLKAVLIFILTLCILYTTAQEPLSFEHLTTADGLSQNEISSLFQDSRGFIWIGTNDGLNRYDGREMKIFQRDHQDPFSIPGNLIRYITEDRAGDLWIGTLNSGICRFDRKTEKFHPLDAGTPGYESPETKRIYSLLPIDEERIWIGAYNGLHLLFMDQDEPENQRMMKIGLERVDTDTLLSPIVFKLYYDRAGNLWIASNSGLYTVENGRAITLSDPVNVKRVELPANVPVRDVLETNNGKYIATQSGIVFIQEPSVAGSQFAPVSLLEGDFRYLIEDSQGMIWAGSYGGLYRFRHDEGAGKPENVRVIMHDIDDPNSLTSHIINRLLLDNSGKVWIGTRSGGINIYSSSPNRFNHVNASSRPGNLMTKKVHVVFEDRDSNLWVGTEGAAVSVLPRGARDNLSGGFVNLEFPDFQISRTINCLTEWNHENGKYSVWYGGVAGFRLGRVALEDEGIRFSPLDQGNIESTIFGMGVIDNKELWIGTYGTGLYRIRYNETDDSYNIADLRISLYGSDFAGIIRAILEDMKGNVWIGTAEGMLFIPSTEKLSEMPECMRLGRDPDDPEDFSHQYIISLLQSENGEIWAGTLGGGLFRISEIEPEDFDIERITVKDGLPNNTIKSIVEDKGGMIWVSTNRGLAKLDPADLNIRNFNLSDGLQEMEFSEGASTLLRDGKLIFGGINGLNIFDPGSLEIEAGMIKVVFTGLTVLNREVMIGEKVNGRVLLPESIIETSKIRLKYKENSFSLSFSDLQYFRPGNTIFRYRLEGFDEEWVTLGINERTARYTSIPHGKYILQVMATDVEGEWDSSEMTELTVQIKPPYYQSPFAYLFYALSVMGSLLLYRRYTMLRFEQKKQLEMERFQKEQTEELTQSKLRFFTNIAHEFRSPLTLMVGPLEKLISGGDDIRSGDRSRFYNLMRRNSHVMLRLIEQLMDFRKLEHGKMKLEVSQVDLQEVVNDVYAVFHELAQARSIRFDRECDIEDTTIWCDRDKIEKILYNLLSNAFKYVEGRGRVWIEIGNPREGGNRSIEVRVSNSGPGIPPDQIGQVFERFKRFDVHGKSTQQGTGVGLAFSKTLVELHKGTITVSSTPGELTTFSVGLLKGPEHFSSDDMMREGSPSSDLSKLAYTQDTFLLPELPEEQEGEEGDRPVLVVVEDNPEMLHFVSASLSERYSVKSAFNGQEALDYCLKIVPDLVVSDIIMPVMDGLELCRQLKSDDRVNHIPLILLTSKTSEADQIAGLDIGAEAYISKPFSIDVLEAQIRSILDARERARQKFSGNMEMGTGDEEFTSLDRKFLDRIMRLIEEKLDDPELSVKYISEEVGLSQFVLNKKLKAVVGITTNTFIRNYRLKKAAEMIEKNRYFVSEVAYEVGFNNIKYFRNCFKSIYGMTPTDYAKKHHPDEE